ncbi:MAG TPA: YraN family protein [Candidatus Magasanikbacteria bacterium]|nr:YraN family protein [Candidatus Magasanikbacteria bacterium]
MATDKKMLGDWGERQAVLFLERRNYVIIARNYRTRGGELDIIARDSHGVLCFVEVKTRSYWYESAARATGYFKLSNLQFAARWYLREVGISPDMTPIRFEQVGVYVNREKKTIQLRLQAII